MPSDLLLAIIRSRIVVGSGNGSYPRKSRILGIILTEGSDLSVSHPINVH
jgi:hypothetical protein